MKEVPDLFSRRYFFEIPPAVPMTGYSGFMALYFLNIHLNPANPEYPVISYKAGRYLLEKRSGTESGAFDL
jgi:hypothetical protein